MITGYNNDIKHRGTIFHVQTEDKGESSAWIESLIYTGGRILARKRVTYKQLLEDGADKPAIGKLMERQHRLMIHQIREGRFDADTSDGIEPGSAVPQESDAKIHTTRIQQQAEAMFAPTGAEEAEEASQPEPETPTPEVEPASDEPTVGEAEVQEADSEDDSTAGTDTFEGAQDDEPDSDPAEEEAVAGEDGPPTDTPFDEVPTAEMPVTVLEDLAEPSSVEEPVAEATATEDFDDEVEVEVGPAPTLDQVIFDYLSSVAQEESLVLLMDESPALATGTTTRMDLGTHASRSGKPIANAVIAVRMISKTGGPVTLAEGSTDEEGTLQLVVEVPEVERDTAALIITAASSIGNAEIKHLL